MRLLQADTPALWQKIILKFTRLLERGNWKKYWQEKRFLRRNAGQ